MPPALLATKMAQLAKYDTEQAKRAATANKGVSMGKHMKAVADGFEKTQKQSKDQHDAVIKELKEVKALLVASNGGVGREVSKAVGTEIAQAYRTAQSKCNGAKAALAGKTAKTQATWPDRYATARQHVADFASKYPAQTNLHEELVKLLKTVDGTMTAPSSTAASSST